MARCQENPVCLELSVRTLSGDVHSAEAAILPSAAWRLVWALGTLKDEREHVLVDGLCPDGGKALNIVGLDVGYSGPGGKTIIPATAGCRVEVYPAEGLSARQVCAMVRAHLDSRGFADVNARLC